MRWGWASPDDIEEHMWAVPRPCFTPAFIESNLQVTNKAYICSVHVCSLWIETMTLSYKKHYTTIHYAAVQVYSTGPKLRPRM